MIAWKVYKINKTKNVITEGEVKGGGWREVGEGKPRHWEVERYTSPVCRGTFHVEHRSVLLPNIVPVPGWFEFSDIRRTQVPLGVGERTWGFDKSRNRIDDYLLKKKKTCKKTKKNKTSRNFVMTLGVKTVVTPRKINVLLRKTKWNEEEVDERLPFATLE
jgi:hypothetical protein